jgi:hypothetical protein
LQLSDKIDEYYIAMTLWQKDIVLINNKKPWN